MKNYILRFYGWNLHSYTVLCYEMHILRFLLPVAVTAEKRSAYLAALSKEYDARLGELQGEEVGTLYIGGGTPSLLSVDEIAGLVSMPVLSADAEVRRMTMDPESRLY